MKQVDPKLANQLVKAIGFKHIRDCDKVISREDIENALKSIDSDLLDELAVAYKNRVSERVNAGIHTPKHLLCLLRRIARRHGVVLTYTKKFKKRKAIFNYKLVC